MLVTLFCCAFLMGFGFFLGWAAHEDHVWNVESKQYYDERAKRVAGEGS